MKYIYYWIRFKLRKFLRESGRKIDEWQGGNWECSNWKKLESNLILRGNKEQRGRKQKKHRGKESWKQRFLSWKLFFFLVSKPRRLFLFFFLNMNYEEDFSQHCEELREEGDNLTKVFVPRWSHCMLINKNLVCCGYPIWELATNLSLNRLWEIPLDESGRLLLLALFSIPNLITCKFQSGLRNGSNPYCSKYSKKILAQHNKEYSHPLLSAGNWFPDSPTQPHPAGESQNPWIPKSLI